MIGTIFDMVNKRPRMDYPACIYVNAEVVDQWMRTRSWADKQMAEQGKLWVALLAVPLAYDGGDEIVIVWADNDNGMI